MNNVRTQRAFWKFVGMAAKIILTLQAMAAALWLVLNSKPDYVTASTLYLVIAAPCLVLLILSSMYKRKLTRKLATIYFN